MKRLATLLILFGTLGLSCGSSGGSGIPSDVPTGLMPVVSRVAPETAARGDEITIFGFGFSSAYTKDVVVIGNSSTSATYYDLVDDPTPEEIEYLEATIPDDAEAGENSVMVFVDGHASNADVVITVTE
jgi:hypothetical protein